MNEILYSYANWKFDVGITIINKIVLQKDMHFLKKCLKGVALTLTWMCRIKIDGDPNLRKDLGTSISTQCKSHRFHFDRL